MGLSGQATDTIYALSSGAVPSAVAVVRISGPAAAVAVGSLCGSLPEPRRAVLRVLRRSDGSVLDRALVIWIPGPNSYTGEDMAELQVHGGRGVLLALFDSLAELGDRSAFPGEFSRRAFANGKLDLTQIEGLADLIAAETEMQRRQAVEHAGGVLARRADDWRDRLLDLRAAMEARLDFSDEGDVPDDLGDGFWRELAMLRDEMAEAMASAGAGKRVREGFRVAILGRPNVGKSSLLNALARRDVAIVTDEAGTTRDVLEVALDLGGYSVRLFDTAGLRESRSAAETEGVKRAKLEAEHADLVLWLDDSDGRAPDFAPSGAVPVWRVRTKIDLCPGRGAAGLAVSSKTGQGLEQLGARLRSAAAGSLEGGSALVTRQRQREALASALSSLEFVSGVGDEVAADLLRSASGAIGRLTGRVGVEDVLDRLFAEFCVGK